jgi:protein-tyrosine phosphatase
MNLIDLSCHFLDETDCGPSSFTESVTLCRTAHDEGVQTMVLTPLWKAGCVDPPLSLERCQEKIARIKTEVGENLDLKLGFVLQFSSELPGLLDQYGSLLALGGRNHLLVSLPANKIPTEAEDVWSAISKRGFVVIVSQPECRPALRRQPERLRSWISNGVKLQLNAASITGRYGREVKRAALDYLENYQDSVLVASNAHAGNGDAAHLKQAGAELSKIFGDPRARKYVSELPATIVGDRESANSNSARNTPPQYSLLRAFGASNGR